MANRYGRLIPLVQRDKPRIYCWIFDSIRELREYSDRLKIVFYSRPAAYRIVSAIR